MTPQPMRGLLWLLCRMSSRDAANAAVGDVLDELADRGRMGRAPRWPRLWVNIQAVTFIYSFAVSMRGRLSRSGLYMLRDAVRSVCRSPTYSMLVIALLAVGSAAGTVTYSVVDAVVLRPLALEQGDRVVSVSTRDDQFKTRISAEAFRDIRDRVTGLESVAKASYLSGDSATIGGVAYPVDVLSASSDLFRVLRFAPGIGRVWTVEEEAREEDVAVLGYRFWMNRLGGNPGVLGQTIAQGKATYRVIGVLAEDTDVPGLTYSSGGLWVAARARSTIFGILGRTQPGVSPVHVAEEVQAVLGAPDWRPAVTPLLDIYVGQVRGWMLLALGAAGLVVLIACVNAANIMLTRAFRRAHELAIRSSLGASRRQIALSVMTEGMILSVVASLCALLFSVWGIAAARAAVTTHLPGTFRASSIALNSRVFTAAIAAAVATGVFSSLVPAWHASRASVMGVLKDAGPMITGGGRWWRSGLVIGEIACMTVLLVVSWLFVTSLIRVVNIDLGVERSHLLAVSPRLPFTGTVDEVRERLEALPGVIGVAEAGPGGASLPLVGSAFGGAWFTSSIQRADGQGQNAALKVLQYRVTPNYFDVAGIRFRRGGAWSNDTALESPPVVLDERAAAQLYGRDDPLGRQIRSSDPAGVFTVVGVVPHTYSRGPEVVDEPAVYFALRPKADRSWSRLFVRTAPPPETMLATVADVLAPVAPPPENGPYIHLVDDAVRRLTATRRFNAGLMSAFGCLAMLIGAAGIYGATAAVVAQQTREIGLRVALGATPRQIHRSVLMLACTYVLLGLAIGLPVAWWSSRGFTAHLFQVTSADPVVYVGVAALVSLVGFAAAFLPARRAAHTDPIITLRA